MTLYIEIHLKRVGIRRGGRVILRESDWRIRPAERWVLLGPSGAGKTQFLKLLAGDVWPTPTGRESRTYLWCGETWTSPYEVKDEITYIGAERHDKYDRYEWDHRVEAIIGTGFYRTDIPLDRLTPRDRQHITTLTRKLGIAQLATRRFLTLSYGERRLTLFARALAAHPKMLLLDEPFNGLDERHRAQISRWLDSTATSGLPWVMATHREEDIPKTATHAVVLEGGCMVYQGPFAWGRLRKWLNVSKARSPRLRRSSTSKAPVKVRLRTNARTLVRLSNASVYLSGAQVLRGISLELRAGECWTISGPNGSGKSALLRAIYGDNPLVGRVERAGIQLGVPLYRFQQRTGLVAPHLQADHPQYLTVAEVVQSGRYASIGLNDPPTTTDRTAVRRALAQFGLGSLLRRPLRELSYGQMRRVLFARAYVRKPQLLLLDEPFAGIDAHTRTELLDRIQDSIKDGMAVIMATHHKDEWPHNTTHELVLHRGRMTYSGPTRTRQPTPGGHH